MTNDAKLGLVVGVGLVITVAIVFFRRDLITRKPTADPAATTIRSSRSPASRPAPRPAQNRTVSRTDLAPEASSGVRHIVQEGDTLEALARHYYGEPTRVEAIVRANEEVLRNASDPLPGTVLVMPGLR